MYVDVDPCCDGGILVVSMKFGVEKLIKPATLHWSIGPKMMDPEVSGKNPTLPETNSSPLKMDGLNTTFLLGRPIFRGYVSFREGKLVSLFQNFSPFPGFLTKMVQNKDLSTEFADEKIDGLRKIHDFQVYICFLMV